MKFRMSAFLLKVPYNLIYFQYKYKINERIEAAYHQVSTCS